MPKKWSEASEVRHFSLRGPSDSNHCNVPSSLRVSARHGAARTKTDYLAYRITSISSPRLFSAVIWIEWFFRKSSASSRAATVSK